MKQPLGSHGINVSFDLSLVNALHSKFEMQHCGKNSMTIGLHLIVYC